jgi:hypothetical protein
MTREQRLTRMAELLTPMRQFLCELANDEEETEAEPTPIKQTIETG